MRVRIVQCSGAATEDTQVVLGSAKAVLGSTASSSVVVPSDSPLYPLMNLPQGWDGFDAGPLPPLLLERANEIITDLQKLEPEQAQPEANAGVDSIWLTWKDSDKHKSLEVRLTCDPGFLIETCITTPSGQELYEEFSLAMSVRNVFRKYLNS